MAFRIPKGVDIFLTQKKYEALLKNHSQYVRWLRAQTCFCIESITKMPNVNCTYCKGRGKIYYAQTELRVLSEESQHDETGRVIPKNCPITAVHSVARTAFNQRVEYTVTGFTHAEIAITAPTGMTLPTWGQTIDVEYSYSVALPYQEVVTYAGQHILELRGLPSQLLAYGARAIQSDIVKVTSVYNITKAKTLTAKAVEWQRNFIYLDETTSASDLAVNDEIQVVCQYVRPFQFALMSVSEKMLWQDAYAVMGSQAFGVIPSNAQVGIGDLLTQASGESRGEEVITYLTAQVDYELAAFDAVRIIAIKDETGYQYVEGTHYVLYRRNRIKFIHATIHPTTATKFSIQYMYNPTFVVMPDKPLVRSAENQTFPRRVNLTVFDKVSPLFDANIVAKTA